jgi:hypothetical protein
MEEKKDWKFNRIKKINLWKVNKHLNPIIFALMFLIKILKSMVLMHHLNK